ncbi:MAG: DUF3592 domain-containing protein [Fimbriiglobus sp.]
MRTRVSMMLLHYIAAGCGLLAGSTVLLAQAPQGKAAGNYTLSPEEVKKLEARWAAQEKTTRTTGQLMFLASFGGGGLLFAVIGAVMVRVAIATGRDLARFVPATGEVVEYQTVTGVDNEGDKFTRHDPVITYHGADGVTRRAVIGGTSVMKFSVGEQVEVLYDPARFDRARIVGFLPQRTSTGFGLAFVVLGGIFFLIGVCVWVSGIPVAMN